MRKKTTPRASPGRPGNHRATRLVEGTVNMLRRPQADQPFLLSNLGDARLSRRYRLWSWAHLAIFVFGCVGLAFWALR
jgi:hypothetical protein